VRLLSKLRRQHAELRRETFLKGTASRTGFKDVSWLHMRGGEMSDNDWRDWSLKPLGVLLGNRNSTAHRLLFIVNAAEAPQSFAVPQTAPGAPWACRFDTARDHAAIRRLNIADHYPLAALCAVLLEC